MLELNHATAPRATKEELMASIQRMGEVFKRLDSECSDKDIDSAMDEVETYYLKGGQSNENSSKI